MEIYLIRHGQTDYNAQKRHTGWRDIPLNESGLAEAAALKKCFENIHLDRVVSSPLQRAAQTAGIVAPALTAETKEWLREIDTGRWTGLTYPEVKEAFPEECAAYEKDWYHSVCGGGESYADVERRVNEGLRQLLESLRPEEAVLIVSHGAVMRLLTTCLLHLPAEAGARFMVDQGAFAHLSAWPDPEKNYWFSLKGWNLKQ